MLFLKRYIVFALPLILVLAFLLVVSTPEKDLLSTEDLIIVPYNDAQSGGNSVVSYTRHQNGEISYTFYLGDSIRFPYAGIMIYRADSSIMDLSAYNTFSIHLKADPGKTIPFYTFTNIKNYSTWNNVNTFLTLQSDISTKGNYESYEVDFDMFYIPNWWYDKQNELDRKNLKANFKEVSLLNFANYMNVERFTKNTIYIDGIIVRKKMTIHYIVSLALILLYYLVLFLLKKYKTNSHKNSIIDKYISFSYKKIDVAQEKDYSGIVFNYINNNYFNSELSIFDIKQETGLPDRKVAQIIKEKTGLTFKQYINKLRLTEAKRLLKETNLQVSEIAYKIGYGNVSHFNRVFKSTENISPTEYRISNG